MAAACAAVGVPLVTGDTKVVDKGKGDGIYVNTSGSAGARRGERGPGPGRGRRRGHRVGSDRGSRHRGDGGAGGHRLRDVARVGFRPGHRPVRALLDAVPDTHVLRDPTRGGLATALCEIAVSSNVGIRLEEAEVPVRPRCRGHASCWLRPALRGLRGRFLAIVPGGQADAALAAIRSRPGGEGARRVGSVGADDPGRLVLKTRIGSHRLLERLSGEQLPRIC